MRVFVTGASGFIGSAVVEELLAAGHTVVGLARSEASATALRDLEVVRGSIEDLDTLRATAATSDGVVHVAFDPNLSKFAQSAAAEARALDALGAALEGSDRPLVVSSGLLGIPTENDDPPPFPRNAGMTAAMAYATRGVRVSFVRNAPMVHGPGDTHGFVPRLISIARAKGTSAYIGDGANRWPAVHRLDTAHLYLLALEKARPGAKLHAVGDQGIPIRAIAESIGHHLDVPVTSLTPAEAATHFDGMLAHLLAIDGPSSSTITRELFGWEPTHPGLLADLDAGYYFRSPA
jgi:nucleoside-diphosphate-sugar epimerase